MVNSTHSSPSLSSETFSEVSKSLSPLILEEWPVLDSEQLSESQTDLEATIQYIASRTERTKALIRRHLAELYQVWQTDSANGQDNPSTSEPSKSPVLSQVDQTLKLLEKRTEKLVAQFEEDVLPKVSEKAKEHVGTSLLTALGVGFILGLLVAGGGRGRS
ncbi:MULTISPECIES: hypothetical protein [unclassified Roseofilum]|uniref:hypothetical protein n=1 Tax=unclassified Roseofilum TaxID=2620099 RepID=UPI000E84A70B|nr:MULTISPECIES: hypothetical protein [unclassified Roseofilum]HBQ97556.1 hypothetical protein [Cyanobacteria bacterium UBA11691]MBP0009292.1 hypothetical protein [Roseofilum sp. Belize Diploria]MBP0013686.1 hypothetical protein [Roseofilum sp. SID3]MBP0023474.1 hypothetical protein [Roseofilum sp. SID2]MBP0032930.1 hypothetical protein [Roseofilum sp. Belize BBD 4]